MTAEGVHRHSKRAESFGRTRKAASVWFFVISSMVCVAEPKAEPKAETTFSSGGAFEEQDGESLYRASCQACHMAHGEGASGAGHYPPLANNPRLASAAYPIFNVLHGRDGMPGFADYMSDEQIAMVVNYTRTHFGNSYRDAVSAKDVRKMR
ncbi:c-type cytochrome [Caballeronia sp.]|uniref:c-type cytochrome n=1 Tax=Caballeronia sp. TaxID=1931223 RepID=UPI003C3A3967